MNYMEYKEVQVPKEIMDNLEKLSQEATPENPATLGEAGVFDWLNEQARNNRWRVVWQGFNFPFVVFEREVVEEVENQHTILTYCHIIEI